MTKKLKDIFCLLPDGRTPRSKTPEPSMSPVDAAKLRRRQEIRSRLRSTTLKQIPESVFAGVTQDYIDNGIGDVTKIVVLLNEEAWLHTYTNFSTVDASSRRRRFIRAVDDWLRTRLLSDNWDSIYVNDVPVSLYGTLVERMNFAWERYAIDELLKNNRGLRATVLEEHPDNEPKIEEKISNILRQFYINRNGRRENLAAAMQERVGINDYNSILRRAREDVSQHVRARYVDGFRRSKPEAIRVKFDDFFNELIQCQVPRFAQQEHVHPELLIRAIRQTDWFDRGDV